MRLSPIEWPQEMWDLLPRTSSSTTSPFAATFVKNAREFNNHFQMVAVILKQGNRGLFSEVPINPVLAATGMRHVRGSATLVINGGAYVHDLSRV